MITLPLILYQVYAFVLPALSGEERRVALPAVFAAPVLFLHGRRVHVFLRAAARDPLPSGLQRRQVPESGAGQVVLQVRDHPDDGDRARVPGSAAGCSALQKVGIITASTLTLNWRYATVLIAVIVAALPGVDPVTMMMETLPLVGLYIASIVLLKWVEHRNHRRARAEAACRRARGRLRGQRAGGRPRPARANQDPRHAPHPCSLISAAVAAARWSASSICSWRW